MKKFSGNFVQIYQNLLELFSTPTWISSNYPKSHPSKAGYTLIAKYAKMNAKCEKQKVHSRVFHVTFFAFHVPFFSFRILQHFVPGSAFVQKLKGFRGLFFAALVKHEIRLKCKKCILSVSYFVVCFAKYPQNAEFEKCTASLKVHNYIWEENGKINTLWYKSLFWDCLNATPTWCG